MCWKRWTVFTFRTNAPQLLLQETKINMKKHLWRTAKTYFAFLQINNPKFRVKLTSLWIKNDKMDLITLSQSLDLSPNDILWYYINIAVET